MLPVCLPRARAIVLVAMGLIALVALAACDDGDRDIQIETTTPPPQVAATEPPLPSTETATPDPTPTPTATPDPLPVRCQGGDAEAMQASFTRLEADIEATMAGYNGEWGVGMVDLDCEVEFAVRPDYVQYTASAGKIVPFIAALRAIEEGELTMEAVEPHLLPAMEHSLDVDAVAINAMVTPAQVQEVLEIAEVSDATDFEYDWRQAFMPAVDLARVWAALLEGDLLSAEMTEYLLDLAEHPDIPPGLETFPLESGLPGYRVGQKAGYYVYDGIPYYLLGAGYLRPVEPGSGGPGSDDTNSEESVTAATPTEPATTTVTATATATVSGTEEAEHAGSGSNGQPGAAQFQGVAMVFQLRSLNPDLFDPQRRTVFPLLADYVAGAYADTDQDTAADDQ